MNGFPQKEYRAKLIETFKECIKFLDSHNLRYYLACGTMLGAIRHKGLIPWDDDIDIYMPRDDYNQLLALKDDLINTNLDILSLDTKNYYQAFAKIINKNTTILEYDYMPILSGVWIDIFPLDLTNRGAQYFTRQHIKFKAKFAVYARGVRQYKLSSVFNDLIHGRFYDFGMKLVCLTYNRVMKNKGLKSFLEFEKSIQAKLDGKNYYSYTETGIYTFNKSWFDEYVVVPFEDFEAKVPKGYQDYLTFMYGDYMTPPPINSRVSEHVMTYLNLSERLEMKEVNKRIKKGLQYEL